ncbi:MAG: M15 family metallopeptidase, partial [Hyphomicrobiaceae bacterium]|nr:M15 family metallopeptidase [Hyphomicrobiaceae bacterium]
LAAGGFDPGEVDGLAGDRTWSAIGHLLASRGIAPDARRGWSGERLLVAAAQAICQADGIDPGPIDGLIGPQTRVAFSRYPSRPLGGRDGGGLPPAGQMTPRQMARPRQADVERVYGPPGTGQVTVTLPWPMRLAWEKPQIVQRTSCHHLIADDLIGLLEAVGRAYDRDTRASLGLDLWGGCLNVRRMRGGSAWSMHAWGIAVDLDPDRNGLRADHTTARLARPDAAPFWRLVAEYGFVGLGPARDYDWMHFQAARL